jgi:hypothetical protein
MLWRWTPPWTLPPETVRSTTMPELLDELDEPVALEVDAPDVDELLDDVELWVVPLELLEQANTPRASAIATTTTRRAEAELLMVFLSFGFESVREIERRSARETGSAEVLGPSGRGGRDQRDGRRCERNGDRERRPLERSCASDDGPRRSQHREADGGHHQLERHPGAHCRTARQLRGEIVDSITVSDALETLLRHVEAQLHGRQGPH